MNVKKYLAYLRYEREVSPKTLQTYKYSLAMAENYFSTPLFQQESQDLQQFLNHLRMQELTPQTLSRHRAGLRGYFLWLKKNNYRKDNPANELIVPKFLQKNLPKTLSPDDIQCLLNTPAENCAPVDIRNHAICELIYSSGLRLAELVALNLEDLHGLPEELIINGKGGKDRRIFIGKAAQLALKRWFSLRQHWLKHHESALFLSQRGRRLTPRGVELQLKIYANKRLLNRNITPHMLRHSFASHILQSSANIRAVQEMLGHSDLSTTQKYTHLDFQHLAKVYDQAHPKARKNKED